MPGVKSTIDSFLKYKGNTTLHTAESFAKALGYDLSQGQLNQLIKELKNYYFDCFNRFPLRIGGSLVFPAHFVEQARVKLQQKNYG
jgi:hypothetical protein